LFISIPGFVDQCLYHTKPTVEITANRIRQRLRHSKSKKERKHTATRLSVDSGYQQPTVSSRTRALSPYTHRKMCQLSEDARQRLHHLHLGPHRFRKETESQPPFLVRTRAGFNVPAWDTVSTFVAAVSLLLDLHLKRRDFAERIQSTG
uniref:Uncharacterized protein n=1 Tax=Acanthochromis polyacanthus TaxID=80966 RepID=A0A3Q1GL98_9TELE